MGDSLFQVLKDEGLTEEWEAEIEAKGRAKVLDLFRQGHSLEEVEEILAREYPQNPEGQSQKGFAYI